MASAAISDGEVFVWRHGKAEVTLTRVGNAWTVAYTTAGRLLGPRQTLYHQTHKLPRYAAWDVMARVVQASRDEDEAVRVGRSAAQWLRAHELIPDD